MENETETNDNIDVEEVRTQFEYRLRVAGISAEQCQEVLADLERRRGLTPDALIEEAKDPAHPLHKIFEWNDEAAAHKFRVMQARFVIRAVGVRYTKADGDTGTVRAFVNVERGTKTYHGVLNVMHDERMRAETLKRAASELESWRRRYEHLAEFAELCSLIARTPVVHDVLATQVPQDPGSEATISE